MEKKVINTISGVGLSHKLFACVIAFFIAVSSAFVCDAKSFSIYETAKVSADTLFSQFFYISTLPMNVISKLFVNTETEAPISPLNKEDKNNSSKNSNSSKASFGYSILPNISSFYQVVKVQNVKYFTLLDKIKKSRVFVWFEDYNFICIENLYKFNFIIMLLLAILLTRRNIGNDNIRIIKNNKLARLTY